MSAGWSPHFDTASLAVCANLPSSPAMSSLDAGWRSTLVEHRVVPPGSREFRLPPTTDTHLVLLVNGTLRVDLIERLERLERLERPDDPRGVTAEAGSLHLVAPGETVRLRYSTAYGCEVGHVFVPARAVDAAHRSLLGVGRPGLLHRLHLREPVLASTCHALLSAAAEGLPDAYAERAVSWLAAHTLGRGVARPAPGERPAARGTDARLARVVELVRTGYGQPLPLDRLAAEAGLTKYHFSRLFHRHTGFTPAAYVEHVRLAAARGYLRDDELSIARVAELSGFATVGQFSAAWKRGFGVPPSVYRRRGAGA